MNLIMCFRRISVGIGKSIAVLLDGLCCLVWFQVKSALRQLPFHAL